MPAKLKFLIVDDDPVNMIVAKKILERRNVEVLSAADAFEALEIVDKNKDLDAVVTDIQLPGMDGGEMVRKMREKGGDCSLIPVFAVTAFGSVYGKDFLLESGFGEVFTKPVDYDEMLDKILMYL